MTLYDAKHHHNDCQECPLLTTRRSFLRDTLAMTGGAALVALGIPAGVAHALATRETTGVRVTGHTGDTATYVIPKDDGIQIDKDNQVILVRWQKAAYAFALSCPHQNTALRWDGADSQFQCPKHHSKYQPNGTFIEGRATRNMDRFSLHREGDNIVVDLTTLHKSSDDESGWKTAVLTLDA